MEKTLATKSSDKEVSVESKKIPDFIEVKDQHGFVTKVVNFDSPKMCPRKGIIEITAIHISNRHENRKSFSVTRDPATGIHFGIPSGIDPKSGRLTFKRIVLHNSMHLNLINPVDAQLWCCISRCEYLSGSPFMVGKPSYKKLDREEQANTIVLENKLKRKASEIIDNVRGVELFDLARACGLSVQNDSIATVQSILYKKAENNPQEFMQIWDNAYRPVLTVFKRGLAVGLVRFDMGQGGYMWKDTLMLGANEASVVKYLMSNTAILIQMDSESKEKDEAFKTYGQQDDFSKSVIDSMAKNMPYEQNTYKKQEFDKASVEQAERVKAKEEKLDKALEELAEMRELLKGKMNGKSEKASENPVKKEKKETIDSTEDEELKKLQIEAEGLGYKGANLIVDKVLLKKYIDDQNEILN